MIQLTPAACQEIHRLRLRENQPDAMCRLDLQPSSCGQWSYLLSLESASLESVSLESEAVAGDELYRFEGGVMGELRLLVKRDRLEYIEGLTVDFSEDLMGGAFRFNNPLATESCRCGYAFAIR